MEAFVFLDVRRVPKTKFQVLLLFILSPREFTDRCIIFLMFLFGKKLSQTTSCHNGASKRMPGTEALIRKSPFQWRDPSLAIIMLSDSAKDPALSNGPQKEGCSSLLSHHHPSEKDACAKLHVTNSI